MNVTLNLQHTIFMCILRTIDSLMMSSTGWCSRVAGRQGILVHVLIKYHLFFSTANNTIQDAGVQYILDTVIKELSKNSERTFIYVEMAFFTRWWKEQNNQTKSLVSTNPWHHKVCRHWKIYIGAHELCVCNTCGYKHVTIFHGLL